MPMDGLTVGFAARELNETLRGGRIDKITQPERDTAVLVIRAGGANHRLLLCASPNNARCHLTMGSFANPLEPPSLCMLMRKQLSGARITEIRQVGGDRIVHVDMDAVNELGDHVLRRLVLEIMGRHSNLLLLDENGRILEAARHVNPEMSRVRQIQPGMSYLRLQIDKGPTADINVRKALAMAIDRDELSENLDGTVTPSFTMISPAETGYSADEDAKMSEELKYDPDGAKALLEQAGWTDTDGDGFVDKDGENLSFEMLIPSDRQSSSNSGSVLQKQFAAIGVDAQIREYEATYIKQLMRDNDFTMAMHTCVWADADILIYIFTDESGLSYNNPTVKDAIIKARQENDPAARIKDYEEVTELLQEDYVGIPVFYENYIVATKSNVEGLTLTNDGRSWFHDCHK